MKYVELMIVLYSFLIAHVTKRFVGATDSSVKTAMAQKCKDNSIYLMYNKSTKFQWT
jgi:hypothetical protein